MRESQIILGIDPGSQLLGYAFMEVVPRKRPQLLSIDMRKLEKSTAKLQYIFEALQKLIDVYQPTSAAIEAPFYGKNVQAMLKLGRAQGTAMVAVVCKGIEIVEYSPRTVKKAVTGKGNATKEQLAGMLPHLVKGDINTAFLDATDALGVAFCHYLQTQTSVGKDKKYSGWDGFLKANPNRESKTK